MRISDWSSDVCSSDLEHDTRRRWIELALTNGCDRALSDAAAPRFCSMNVQGNASWRIQNEGGRACNATIEPDNDLVAAALHGPTAAGVCCSKRDQADRARKSAVYGKRGSGRVTPGG